MKINVSAFLHHLIWVLLFLCFTPNTHAQFEDIKWSKDGNSYFKIVKNEIVKYSLPDNTPNILLSRKKLTPSGKASPITIDLFKLSEDQQKVLIFTNTSKVWRLHTKGDYWIYDLKKDTLFQAGKSLPSSSIMFAKFSPDAKSIAYVSGNNIYIENLASSTSKALTTDGSATLINGTFDWVYEEEFNCRDGFRWSEDGKTIAFWQVDASSIRKFDLINNTDSMYAQIIPVEYPKVGENPSKCRLGVVQVADSKVTWMNVPGDPEQNYLIRMEFIPSSGNLLIQQLNRKQNDSKLYIADIVTGNCKIIEEETDSAWVDVDYEGDPYSLDYSNGFTWLNASKNILWSSEKDGWRHLYRVSLEGKPERLITNGNYDVINIKYADPKDGYVYFTASPDNPTQQYLFRTKLNGSGNEELINPSNLTGTHNYSVSPSGTYACHTFSNHSTRYSGEFISMVDYKPLQEKTSINSRMETLKIKPVTEFFRVTTSDNLTLDGWMVKPVNFDPTKKYPVVFLVYTEPWESTVFDTYLAGKNRLYKGDMAEDGYIYMSVDNRGTASPRGRTWRKSIYRKIGQLNIHDQAMAAREIMKWNFVDPERIAVWGWSGGGSATLNLMFQYPDIYKTGIAIAAVTNLFTYDNIYEERYMGLPGENKQDYINGSPITYAKNLQGSLLYIHGTGDDNVHYQNAEMLINELIKYNKQFQFMSYPNRTHSLAEGEGTFEHLSTLYTNYLHTHCPPGGK